jgi:hypothetical protein
MKEETFYYLAEALREHGAGDVATALEQQGCFCKDRFGRILPVSENEKGEVLDAVAELCQSKWSDPHEIEEIAPDFTPLDLVCDTPEGFENHLVWRYGWPVEKRPNFSKREEVSSSGNRHDNRSDKLALMNQASFHFWARVNRTDRSKHPTNSAVAQWLESHGFTPTQAASAASLIRPEWAPTGRKPEQ